MGQRPIIRAYMTDPVRDPDVMATIRKLPKGCLVIYRHYDILGREDLGRQISRLCRRLGLPFIVAGDLALARRLGAKGVHFPTFQLRLGYARQIRDPRWKYVTAATKTARDVYQARKAKCDLLLISPVLATESHPEAQTLGPLGAARVAGGRGEDVLALGGMTAERLRQLRALKPIGFAAISGVRPNRSEG